MRVSKFAALRYREPLLSCTVFLSCFSLFLLTFRGISGKKNLCRAKKEL